MPGKWRRIEYPTRPGKYKVNILGLGAEVVVMKSGKGHRVYGDGWSFPLSMAWLSENLFEWWEHT